MSSFIAFILVISNIQHFITTSYSHIITEDTTFYYKQLTTDPSLIMEVEFSILCIDYGLRFNMYTTKDHANLQRNYFCQNYKHLYNQPLWVPLRSGNHGHYICLEEKNGLLLCTWKTTIQDFKARNLGFSFGYECDNPDRASLEGLSFNISVSGQRNKSECIPIYKTTGHDCSEFYSFVSFPNLFGYSQEQAVEIGVALFQAISLFPGGCYKFLKEMFCYILIPKCDSIRNVTVPPCRENCWDFDKGCFGIIKKILNYTGTKTSFLNCNYLPKKGLDDKCFYKAVTCEDPPKIPNGKIEGGVITKGTYTLHTQLNISCVNETFVMKGNNTITCGYTGTWSKPPQCSTRMPSTTSSGACAL